jgi:aarF domain-containing kinase
MAIPAFLSYKRVQLLKDRLPRSLGLPVDEASLDAEYETLHAEWAPRAMDVVLALRGFNLKTGQLVASNFGNVFPKAWQAVFEPLLDAVPHKPFSHVRATVERELGKPLAAVFSRFEEEPLAAASIGQVHRATLAGSGEAVVVKVMYPEVEGQFRGDVFAAKRFAAVALPEHVKPLEEIEKQFANEFDYRREAAQLAQIRANLAPVFPHIIVPRPHLALCTKAVLVMDEVPRASKLTTALAQDMEFFAAMRGVSVEKLVKEEEALNAAALARGELRCGPSAAEMARVQREVHWLNWWRWATGRPAVRVPLNHAALVDELLCVHGHEVLVDGAFNGDPHPGNLLVTRDEAAAGGARLALVDYGQVKVLSAAERLQVARLMVGLARADEHNAAHRRAVAALLRDMGTRTARNDPDVMFEMARLFFDRDDKLVTRGKNTQAFIEELNARDAADEVGQNFVLVARCSLMLRGLGHLLNQHRSAAKAWAPIAERVLLAAGELPDGVLDVAEARVRV